MRLKTANRGSVWGESYSFDPFGNIYTSVLSGSTGFNWQPTYTHGTTNTYQYFSLPGFTPHYDANGKMLTDSFHTYTWDAEGKMLSLDTTTLTYDALGRMVEQDQSGTYFQIVYTPMGKRLAIMKAQVIQQAFVPLPGNAKAEYLSWGLSNYRHADWLGSARLESSTTHGIVQDTAYDAFGVPYSELSGGNGELSFTGQNKDTAWLQYDFRDRQYDPKQGRWISPDPTGLKAVDFTSPQTWNRYAYVQNNPLALVDPFGDDGCYNMGDASCTGYYFGGGMVGTYPLPDGTEGGIYGPSGGPVPNTPAPGLLNNGAGGSGSTGPGSPNEFDIMEAENQLEMPIGIPFGAQILSGMFNSQWNRAWSYTANNGVMSPPTGWTGNLLTLSDFMGESLSGGINGFPSGPGWTGLVGKNCAQAAQAIKTWIAQNGTAQPLPPNLVQATLTCGQPPM